MIISHILLDFIHDHINDDPEKLILKYYGKDNQSIDYKFAVVQIECRRKYRHKLPNFISSPSRIFPSSLAAEQASHEAVVSFHARLAGTDLKILDMTAGLGVDAMAFASNGNNVTAIDSDSFKAECLLYNAKIENLDHLEVINGDSVKWLKNHEGFFDLIYIDPARRDSHNNRVFLLQDCIPDVAEIQDIIFCHSPRLLVKASPLLDITSALNSIKYCVAARVVCVEGECKEVLIEANRDNDGKDILYEAVDIFQNGKIKSLFSYSSSDQGIVEYATLDCLHSGMFLYEPNAAVMKLSPWTVLSARYPSLKKLSKLSHLFVSDELYINFPGRITAIEGVIEKKDRKTLKGFPANVVSRNYPESADELRKRLSLKEGKDSFIYATKLGDKPILFLTKRV